MALGHEHMELALDQETLGAALGQNMTQGDRFSSWLWDSATLATTHSSWAFQQHLSPFSQSRKIKLTSQF